MYCGIMVTSWQTQNWLFHSTQPYFCQYLLFAQTPFHFRILFGHQIVNHILAYENG